MSDFLASPLVQRSLLALLLTSIACGAVGAYVVVRRCSYMVGSISHSLLGGIGLALFCREALHLRWSTPLAGALAAALASTVLLTLLTRRNRLGNDVVLSAVWALGMAAGVSFIFAIPGYPADLNSYLFGDIWLVTADDLRVMLVLDAVVLAMVLMFHNRFLCLCFHEEGLRLRGVRADWYLLLLHLLIALTVVQLAQVVGIVLCLALLVLPAAAAANLCRRMPGIMLAGSLGCLLCSAAGLYAGYRWDLPTGAVIVEITGGAYLLSIPLRRLLRRRPRTPPPRSEP